ncbi:MAG: ABC transporter permease [Prevotellaceae bacterium]|nr:ABC transporter permease [Prevotellaceae bacterium]MDY5946807.1 ABC transporter permease [Prevotella sp.]
MNTELLTELWATARRNKLRTALTGFAVAWGIFMIIFLLGAGNGLINAVTQNSAKMLDNSMMVWGGLTSKPYNGLKEGRWVQLDDRDLDATRHEFAANIDEVGATVNRDNLTFSLGDNYYNTTLSGVYPNEATINKKEMLFGRFINDIDISQDRKVVVISRSLAEQLVSHDVAQLVGRYINVGDFAFRVVGIYKTEENSSDNNAYTAFTTLRKMYGMGDKAGNIVFSFHGLNTEQQNDNFEKQYTARINRNHQADPTDRSSVWIWNRFTQNMQMNKGMTLIRLALWVIGLFTLLSGVVGVSNIMLITVKERTREFGIRKAIGATPASLLRLIIAESVVITLFFGYIGMLCGIAANEYMNATIGHTVVDSGLFKATMFVNPTVGLDVCFGATAVMVVAGTLAGLMPAWRAARIRPIEALRAE